MFLMLHKPPQNVSADRQKHPQGEVSKCATDMSLLTDRSTHRERSVSVPQRVAKELASGAKSPASSDTVVWSFDTRLTLHSPL